MSHQRTDLTKAKVLGTRLEAYHNVVKYHVPAELISRTPVYRYSGEGQWTATKETVPCIYVPKTYSVQPQTIKEEEMQPDGSAIVEVDYSIGD